MKEKKDKTKKRHEPLGKQIEDGNAIVVRKRNPTKVKKAESDEAESYVESKLSSKILLQAREQQDDIDAEDDDEYEDIEEEEEPQVKRKPTKKTAGKGGSKSKAVNVEFSDDEFEAEGDEAAYDPDQGDFYRHLDIAPEDEAALAMFMPKDVPQRLTLADIIMSKIKEKETELASQMSQPEEARLEPRIVKVFASVGRVLATYRSGKIPKAFKIIPTLKNWEEILQLTNPDSWTAAAMFQATRLFASNFNPKLAQRFLNLVLLPRVRDDLAEYKRLNFHLFMALKKAIFKPAAFFKGILLPICEAGDCSLRDAVILSSVLARTSIPVLHSSAALLKIAEMPYNGANSIFLRVLLNKKYALPFRVIDALVAHFHRFTHDNRDLPVLWHQSLLVFAQRYKEDITSEQKQALFEVMRSHTHPKITPEIRRELVHSRSRDGDIAFEGEASAL